MEPIETRVNRGAALLDEKVPGWWERIDLEQLQLSSCIRCVLGQLFGIYGQGIRELGDSIRLVADAIRHGLFVFDAADYEPLTAAWKQLIQQRRQKVSPAKVWEKPKRRGKVVV